MQNNGPDARKTTHDAEDDPRNRNIKIYVNGNLVPRAEAMVSVYDSGFMLGDGMWEGMRLHNGKWVFFEEHMDRLFESCKAVSLDIGLERAGADEGLMLDPHGFVNTTNACNFFIVRRGAVWTSTGDYCMNGVTRQKVIDLCRQNDIPVFAKNFSLVECHGADEAFLTGSFAGLTPVAEIDGNPVGSGKLPGPVTRSLQAHYTTHVAKHTS